MCFKISQDRKKLFFFVRIRKRYSEHDVIKIDDCLPNYCTCIVHILKINLVFKFKYKVL